MLFVFFEYLVEAPTWYTEMESSIRPQAET
jgi:hypothetical protein